MILAPLSCPSRPTFATTTLIVRAIVPPLYSYQPSAFGFYGGSPAGWGAPREEATRFRLQHEGGPMPETLIHSWFTRFENPSSFWLTADRFTCFSARAGCPRGRRGRLRARLRPRVARRTRRRERAWRPRPGRRWH